MAAESNGDIIWTRNTESLSDHDDVWDDSALIEAYDRAVGQVKEELAKRGTGEEVAVRKKTHHPKAKSLWKVGDYCNTLYPEDELCYEAYIKEISESGDKCLIEYVGYGNSLVVPISALKPALGKEAREKQELESQQIMEEKTIKSEPLDSSMDWSRNEPQKKHRSSRSNSQAKSANKSPKASNIPNHQHQCSASWPGFIGQCGTSQRNISPIPPPPAFPLDQGIPSDEEALAAMLMSWYMSGYHTGYYQALRQQTHRPQLDRKGPPNCTGCSHSSK